jgi:dephospho-CoA kinase
MYQLCKTRAHRTKDQQLEIERTVAVVLDAPLLFKAGWDELCDKLVFVDCEKRIRIKR